MAKKSKEQHALVEVLQPSATSAFDQANQAVEALPSVRLPLHVRSVEHQQVCTDMLRQVATTARIVEEKRKSVTTHLDAAKRALNKLFEPLKTRLTDLRSDLEDKLNEYREWQEEQAEVEREELRKKAEAQRKRLETATAKKLAAARTPQEARRIKQEAAAKKQVAEAVLDARLADVDGTPAAEEGIAVIEDYEIEVVDADKVPQEMGGYYLWKKDFNFVNLRKLAKAGVEVPGVRFYSMTRRAVRSM